MTLSDIRLRAARQAGEAGAPDPDTAAALTAYINEGLRSICPEGIPATIQIEVVNGQADVGGCGALEVMSMRGPNGAPLTFSVVDGSARIDLDGICTARIMRAPTELTRDDDECDIPGEFHGALADYAAWRLLSTGGRTQQLRAEHYYQAYLMQRSRLQNRLDAARGPRRRVNKYG